MARLILTYLAALQLMWFGTVCCLTNLELYNLVKDHASDLVIDSNATSCERLSDSDVKIDETLCDDVISVPGGPNDEFDEDYFLQKVGFVPFESDNECDIIGNPEHVDETLKYVEKYCHHRQYHINGLQDDTDLKSIHFHFHHHGQHHHSHYHHHCHNRDYVKCTCERRQCSCCLRHTFRFNHCTHRTTFELNAWVVIKYKGKKPCHTTTTRKPETTTTTTKKPDITTPTTKKPDITTPTTKKPDITTPTTKKPDITTPTTKKPDITTPTTKKPDITTPTPVKTTTTTEASTTVITPPPNEECPCERNVYDVTFTVNNRKILENSVSLNHLHPLCYNLRLGAGTANVCLNFYSVDVRRRRVCTRITGVWKIGHKETQLYMNVGCMVLSFSRNTDLMDIFGDEKFWREMVMDQKFDEE